MAREMFDAMLQALDLDELGKDPSWAEWDGKHLTTSTPEEEAVSEAWEVKMLARKAMTRMRQGDYAEAAEVMEQAAEKTHVDEERRIALQIAGRLRGSRRASDRAARAEGVTPAGPDV